MLAVRDVLLGLGVDVLLGQPEVDDVDGVLPLGPRTAHQEVLGLHVAVDEALGVHVLHARDQLDGDHEHRLEREGAVAQVEEVLQAGPQQLQHHGVVLPARAEVVDLRDALCGAELLVEPVLQVQLRGPGLDGLQFDSHVLVRIEVLSEAKLPEVAAAYLLADSEVGAHHQDPRAGPRAPDAMAGPARAGLGHSPALLQLPFPSFLVKIHQFVIPWPLHGDSAACKARL